MVLESIYVVLLFGVYRIIMGIANFSINTVIYGLFALLIFFYYITDNLNFRKQGKYNPIWINAIIFLIFLFFYKKVELFLVFSVFQLSFERLLKKMSIKKDELYNPSVFNIRSFIKVLIDLNSVVFGIFFAFMIKYSTNWYTFLNKEYIIIYSSIFLLIYLFKKMSEKSWSYTNILDVLDLMCLNIATAIIFTIFIYLTKAFKYSFSTLILVVILSLVIQLFARYVFRLRRYYNNGKKHEQRLKRAIIYGAGEAGAILARESYSNPRFPYDIIGFIDDDKKKVGTEIYKVKVLGTREALYKVIEKEKVDEILLALPRIKGKEIKSIIEEIENLDRVQIKTLSGIDEILENKDLTTQLRSVKIEDLLGRDEISINSESIRGLLEGKTIVVTGGAGSIGSELARQIAKYNPKQLVAIDINENDIYFLELELKRTYPNLKYTSEICNIREREKLEFLFEKYRPDIVFHAAAYKHVPLMEHNPEEAIKNNIFGTKNVAECADKYRVQRMVLISTDKAVNPTNLMGASKRACELVIEHMNKVSKNTKFMAVRFGNVLGSHGSVIPIFRNLIEEGKNLTVTHKDITRYFMTIPEAAQLVIEAGAIGEGGDIFILDMGKPVKIYDLAQSMIKISNAKVGIDIVGLRPGEKLYEELLYDVNNAIKTENKKIFITTIKGHRDITQFYDKLEECTHNPDIDNIKSVMKELVVSYREVNYEEKK